MINKKAGFTIIEVLIASVISVMVLGAALTAYIIIQRSWKEAVARVFLQQKARIIMNKIIYGGGGTEGIIEAKETEIHEGTEPVTEHKPGDTIHFKLEDDIERCYYIANEKICFDPDYSIQGNEIALNNPEFGIRATGLEFIPESEEEYLIGIALTLEQTVQEEQDRNIRVRLQSMIKERN